MAADKINVRISPVAFMKMQTLVMGFDKEVGWYGTVERIDEGFRVTDILVFPQYTSATYIDDERDDPLEFRKWLDTLSDEQYNSRRLWAHSHVNMGVSPSGTDTDMFKRFNEGNCVEGIPNRFTLCLIINKRTQMFWWAYDADAKKEYKDKDINVMIEVEEGQTNLEYFEWAKGLVRDIYPTTAFLFGCQGYSGGGYKGYATGYNYGTYNTYAKNKAKQSGASTEKAAGASKVIQPYGVDIYDDYGDPWWDSYYDGYTSSATSKGGSTPKTTGSTEEKSGSTNKGPLLPDAKDPIPIDSVMLKDYEIIFSVGANGIIKAEAIELESAPNSKDIDVYDLQEGIYKTELSMGNSYTFSLEAWDLIPQSEGECNTVIQLLLYYYFNDLVDNFNVNSQSHELVIDSEETATEMLNAEFLDFRTMTCEDKEGEITHTLYIEVK